MKCIIVKVYKKNKRVIIVVIEKYQCYQLHIILHNFSRLRLYVDEIIGDDHMDLDVIHKLDKK
jgi:hypothetical protein